MIPANRIQFLPSPTNRSRVETGAVQFGDDWPGLFIRGDQASHLALVIRRLAERLAEHPDFDVADSLRFLLSYADTIERDVLV